MLPRFAMKKAGFFLVSIDPGGLSKRPTLSKVLFAVAWILGTATCGFAAGREPSQISRNLPLSFEENRGQGGKAFRYLLRYNGSEAMFSAGGVEFRPAGHKAPGVRMLLLGANVEPQGKDPLEGRSNYLIGADVSKWIRNIPHYGQIEYDHLYSGISLAFYGNGNALEHDYQVAPGGDPSQILFRFDGGTDISIAAEGDLKIRAPGQVLTLRKPVAYQMGESGRLVVEAQFVLGKDGSVGFQVGAYDRTRMLVIDPVFVFSSYLGGSGNDTVGAVTTDAAGNIYLTGSTSSTDFPTANPLQAHLGGCDPFTGCENVFITKLNPSGTALIYSTYLGGSSQDSGSSIAVDRSGNAIVAGFATSSDFPKAGSIQSPTCQINNACFFLASLKPDGSALNYSGMIGGSGPDVNGDAGHVALDTSGNAYLTGYTQDPNFQITAGTLAASVTGYPYTEAFVLKVDPTGKLLYSTVIPGNATQDPSTNNNEFVPTAIAVDSDGQTTIAGFAGLGLATTKGVIAGSFPYNTTNVEDPTAGFVLQINATASALNFASYLPGTNSAGAMTVDSKGNLYFGGWTSQKDLPVSSSAYQKAPVSASANNNGIVCGYILELSPKAVGVVAATYLDGTTPNAWENSSFTGIALDSRGNIYVGGETGSPDFPLQNPFTIVQSSAGTVEDMVLAGVSPNMSSLIFGSFLDSTDVSYGGSVFSALTVDDSDKLVVVGGTYARDFPTTKGSFESELPPAAQAGSSSLHTFVAKIDMSTPAASACLSTFNISFGRVAAGSTATQTLNVTNCGNAPLELSSIVASDPTVTATQNCSSVAVGAVCPLTLTFKPVVDGNVSGTITILDNAVLPSPGVSFAGVGLAPKIWAQSPAQFPAQVLGVSASGAVATLFLQNVGSEALVINPAQTLASGDFSVTNDGCTYAVSAGSGCLIQVSFTPTQLGLRTGTLSIASNDPGNPLFAVLLTGTALAAYPVATVSQVQNPAYAVTTATTPITASVQGTGFFPSSVVYVNGVAQATTYQSSTNLNFSLSPTLLDAMAELPVTVVNPAPGGGSSASFPLTVYLSLLLQSSSLVVDPVGGLLYAAIPASAPQNPSTIIAINPATGAVMTPVAVSSDPQHLAVSEDGTELYVATSAGVLQRLNLKTLAIEKTFNLPVDSEWGQTYVQEMHVVPGSPKLIVVELFAHVDPAEDGAALYNDSGLVNWIPGVNHQSPLMLDSFTFTSPTAIYGLPEGASFFGQLQVSSTGLSVVSASGFGCCNESTGSSLTSDGTLLYTNSGEVWNPTTQTLLGTYLEASGSQLFYVGRPVPDTANGHTYFLDNNSGTAVNIYNQVGYGLGSTLSFWNANLNNSTDLVRWGDKGLAFRNYDSSGFTANQDQIVILVSSRVKPSSAAPIPIVSSVSPPSVYVGGPAFALQIKGDGFTSASTATINGQPRSTTFVSSTSLTTQVLSSDIATAGQLNVQVTTPAPGGGSSDAVTVSIGTQIPLVSVTPSSLNVSTTQALNATISVSGAAGYPAPTGSVVLSGSTYSSAAVALSGGSATISFPAGSLLVGTDTLTAQYTPDSAGASLYRDASGVATVSVGTGTKSTPSVAVALSSSHITTAQQLAVTVTVNGGTANPTPTGSLAITLAGNILEEPALVNGSAAINIAAGALPVGTDTLTVNYTPDSASSSAYNNATGSATVAVTLPGKITPTVTVMPSASSLTTAQVLTATVVVNGGSGHPAPTGSVTLSGGGFASATTALSNGNASITIPPASLVVGSDALTATYAPDAVSSATYNSATGTVTVDVSTPIRTASSTVTVTPSAGTITNAQAVNVTVTVVGAAAQPLPTGIVTLASGSYSTQQALASGATSFTIAAGVLASGTDTLTASYMGDANFASASGAGTVTVSQVTVAAPAPAPVTPGGTANATLTLSAGNGYSGTMNLACALTSSPAGAVSQPTCSLNPASVSLTSGGSGTANLVVHTTAASSTALAQVKRVGLLRLGGGTALAAVFFFFVPRRRRAVWMVVLLCLGVTAWATGCGGSTSQTRGPTTPATTGGNYTFTITGTDSVNAHVTASTSVAVTVQ